MCNGPKLPRLLVADLVSSLPCRWSRRSVSELGPGASLSARLIVHGRPCRNRVQREVTLSATCIVVWYVELNQTSNRRAGLSDMANSEHGHQKQGLWKTRAAALFYCT